MADDLGFQPSNDLGFQPMPKIPDTSGVQNMAQKNLSAPTEGEGEPKPQTDSQKLDTAMGFSATGAMKGGDVQFTPDMRGHLVDAYKNGSASNAGDFMQSTLHSVVPLLAGAGHPVDTAKKISDEIGGAVEQTSQRYVGTMAYPFLSKENQQKLEKAGIVPPPSGEPISPDAPQWVKELHGFSEGVQGTLGTALSAPFLPVSAASAPIVNPVLKKASKASPSGYQSVTPDLLNLAMTFGGLTGLHHVVTRGTQFPPGQGPWDNHPGANIMRELVNKDNPDSVTSSQIDQTIAQGFTKRAPEAQDFHDVAGALDNDTNRLSGSIRPEEGMGKLSGGDAEGEQQVTIGQGGNKDSGGTSKASSTVDILHNIYTETGLRPDQVFEDAQRDPSIKEDIGAGRFPSAYEHLKDTRPPIPDEVQSAMDRLDKMSKEEALPETPRAPPTIMGRISQKLSEMITPDAQTRASVNNLQDFKNVAMEDPIQAAKIAARYIQESFAPSTVGEDAGAAATILREHKGERNRATAIAQYALNKVWRQAASLTGKEKDNFIDHMQGVGEPQKLSPEIQEVADTVRKIYQERKEALQSLPGNEQRAFIKNYFTQNWKDTPTLQRVMDERLAQQGTARNLNQRVIPTHAEGRALGLEDKFDHPLETVMNYVANVDKLVEHTRVISDLQERGLAARFRDGDVPPGYQRIEGTLGENNGDGALYARSDAARIYNNSISEGFTGAAGEIFKAANFTSNVLRRMKLGFFNLFHGGTATIASMLSESGLGFGELAESVNKAKEGNITGALKNIASGITRIATNPLAPIKHFFEGAKGLREYKTPGSTDPETQYLVNLLTKANAVTHTIPDYMKSGAYHDMWDSWRRGDYDNFIEKSSDFINGLTAKNAAMKIPALGFKTTGQFMDMTMKPVFQVLVPRLKMGVALEAMRQWIADHPDSTYEEQAKQAAKFGDSVDNRMGEMMQDNLFLHKKMEQSMNMGFLSYGWVLGQLRGGLLGVKDIATFRNTANAQHIIGFIATTAMLNAMYQYIKTGQPPEDIKDLIAPQTGGIQKAGGEYVPERIFLPGHSSELAHYQHDFLAEIFGNEANPIFGALYTATTGKDWAGYDITNRNNDFYDKMKDYTAAIQEQLTPISIETMERGAKKGSNINVFERALGERQIPAFMANPEGVEEQEHNRNERAWGAATRFRKHMEEQYENSE